MITYAICVFLLLAALYSMFSAFPLIVGAALVVLLGITHRVLRFRRARRRAAEIEG